MIATNGTQGSYMSVMSPIRRSSLPEHSKLVVAGRGQPHPEPGGWHCCLTGRRRRRLAASGREADQ